MMTPFYEIAFEPEHWLIRATLRGFWTVETVAAYRNDLAGQIQRMPRQSGPVRLLVHGEKMAVQSRDVGAAFADFNAQIGKLFSGPVAIIAGSTINKMQASRFFPEPRVGVFLSASDAEAWLFAFPENADCAGQ